MNTRSKTIFQAVVLILLFTMQGLCHAHQLDHIVSGDNTPCSICSAGGQLQSAIVETTSVSAPGTRFFAETRVQTLPPTGTVTFSQGARAPPFSR